MDVNVGCSSGQNIHQFSEIDKKVDSHSGQEKLQSSAVDENVINGKSITQMTGDELKVHLNSSGHEFSSKMEENFKCYVFIAPSKGTQDLEQVVQTMAYFIGYQMHKTVGCSKRIYHLYVKYEAEYIAIAARDFFRSKEFHAEIVDDMLRLWYAYEKASGLTKCPTIGWLTAADGRPVTTESARLVIRKYGNPHIIDKHARFSFSTIAEAFGACIALGPWYFNDMLAASNYYSFKIELSEHCYKIMSMCNMTNVESGFDYFVQNDPKVYTKRNDNSSLSKPDVDTKANGNSSLCNPSVCSKANVKNSLHANETKSDQPARPPLQSWNGKRPNRAGPRNRNGGRIFKRHNDENVQFPSQHNRFPQSSF